MSNNRCPRLFATVLLHGPIPHNPSNCWHNHQTLLFSITALGLSALAAVVGPRRVSKKVARPVSMGSSGDISNGFGLARSTSMVELVLIVRLSRTLVYRTTELKYCGIFGLSFCPTPCGKPFFVPSGWS